METTPKPPLKVALVHEWITTIAGSEKVVEQILELYPDAEIFTIYADPEVLAKTSFLKNKVVHTSFLQRLPWIGKRFRALLPLLPLAVEQFDLSRFDLVISSAHAVAKGVITGPDQVHISYVHSPIRYAWDLQHQYLRESKLDTGPKSWLIRYFLHKIRIWDHRTGPGVDLFLANSKFIARRIHKIYRREAQVIYPPVDVDFFQPEAEKKDFYLAASRLVPYKKIDIIVEAFASMPDKTLYVIGDGPDFQRLKARATPNVHLMGYADSATLQKYMREAKAYVFAAEEDFGIMPVEAQACGTPVIAYGKGGALETVRAVGLNDEPTGTFFYQQTGAAVADAVERFEQGIDDISAANCRRNAERFSTARFKAEFQAAVDSELLKFEQRR